MSSQPPKQKDTVTELCIKLGCCSKDTKWSRGRQPALARKTGTFRKNFIGADTFPIEHDDPIVQECALRFFDEDRENAVQMIDGERDKKAFFHGKSGEIKNDRFSSPDDKETYVP
jgi:hypothetical protein